MKHLFFASLLLAACGANESSDNASTAPTTQENQTLNKVTPEQFKQFCSQDMQKDGAIGPNFAGRFCTCLQEKYPDCGAANIAACFDTAKKSFGEQCFSIAVETAPEE